MTPMPQSSLTEPISLGANAAKSSYDLSNAACLQSPGPEDCGDQINHRCEAGVGLFVARGDTSKRLERTEEIFDKMTPLVLFSIMRGVSSGPFAAE